MVPMSLRQRKPERLIKITKLSERPDNSQQPRRRSERIKENKAGEGSPDRLQMKRLRWFIVAENMDERKEETFPACHRRAVRRVKTHTPRGAVRESCI